MSHHLTQAVYYIRANSDYRFNVCCKKCHELNPSFNYCLKKTTQEEIKYHIESDYLTELFTFSDCIKCRTIYVALYKDYNIMPTFKYPNYGCMCIEIINLSYCREHGCFKVFWRSYYTRYFKLRVENKKKQKINIEEINFKKFMRDIVPGSILIINCAEYDINKIIEEKGYIVKHKYYDAYVVIKKYLDVKPAIKNNKIPEIIS